MIRSIAMWGSEVGSRGQKEWRTEMQNSSGVKVQRIAVVESMDTRLDTVLR